MMKLFPTKFETKYITLGLFKSFNSHIFVYIPLYFLPSLHHELMKWK